MNLSELFGPTMSLKQLCQVLNMSRTSYYNYTQSDQDNSQFKHGFPKPLQNYRKRIFITAQVEEYILGQAG